MNRKDTVTAKDIERMRGAITVLYFSDIDSGLNPYERMQVVESMLQTYLTQDITYSDLYNLYVERLRNNKSSE